MKKVMTLAERDAHDASFHIADSTTTIGRRRLRRGESIGRKIERDLGISNGHERSLTLAPGVPRRRAANSRAGSLAWQKDPLSGRRARLDAN